MLVIFPCWYTSRASSKMQLKIFLKCHFPMERKNFPKIWTLVFLLIFAKRTSESDDLTPFRNKINIGEYIACLQIMSLLYGISYTFGQNTQFGWLNHMTISFANKKTPSLPTCKTKLKNNSTTSSTRSQNFGCFLDENSAKITIFNHAIFLLKFSSQYVPRLAIYPLFQVTM